MDQTIQEQWLIFGGSRGLGASLLNVCDQSNYEGLMVLPLSRKRGSLSENRKHMDWDLSRAELFDEKKAELDRHLDQRPIRIVYSAGGGPFGRFDEKDFKDHNWAFQVNFLSAAQILHGFLTDDRLRQFIYIGSQVAESRPDPLASSYSASKHAMLGLIKSIQKESPQFDLRLFSPSYMDTDLLPKNAVVRRENQVSSPSEVANKLFQWMLDPMGNKHYIWNP